MAALSPGTRFGSFEIVSPLGAGGMGEVYRARDSRLNRGVALKVLPALLAHDPEGPTLAERIEQGPIPVEEALPIALQIADALEAAHEIGIIHRDLKPANIKVTRDGVVQVLDFVWPRGSTERQPEARRM